MKRRILFLILFLISLTGYAGEKDLRLLFKEYGIPVYNQGERGTCSVFAITGLLEFEYAHTLRQNTLLSVEYLNWASNMITGKLEDGSFFSDEIKALKKYGVCANELFPYYLFNYSNKVEPSATASRDAKKRRDYTIFWVKEWNPETGMTPEQIAQVKNQINNEHPVAIGFRWPKKDEKYRKIESGLMYVPPEEGVFDGHSVLIVGFKDDTEAPGGGYFIFKNSHGEGYEEKGYGKMPYEYVEKYANDGVVIYINK